MKLLFDENLSPKLVALLAREFPGSNHLDLLRKRGVTDGTVWNYAKDETFILVSKDSDFRQRAFLEGPPPKVIWLSVGNAGTALIETLLRTHLILIEAFSSDPEQGLLVLELF